MSSPLLIAGFHRSGTSLLAQMFHAAGLHMGDNLLGAKASNPHGHFEDTEVIAMHDRALGDQGHAWYQDRGAVGMLNPRLLNQIKTYAVRKRTHYPAFGIKDPRLCLTIRHWHAALSRVNVVFLHRDADLSITSLWARALRDHQAGRGRALNGELVRDPDLVGRIYGHNVASFLSWYRTLGAKPDNVIFAQHADVISGRRNLVHECRARWGYALDDSDVSDFFDPEAVTVSRQVTVTPRDPGLASHLRDMNATLQELCAA